MVRLEYGADCEHGRISRIGCFWYGEGMDKKIITRKSRIISPLFLTGQERLLLLRNIRGMWKHRKPDPIKELEKMRREWDREIG
jgi:hypothetical protein